ncbi:MAG: hypothetical protein LBU58_06555, partial [Clostridiales bacterium]|nr:hypothetical protein [Clostridiales bacterium]
MKNFIQVTDGKHRRGAVNGGTGGNRVSKRFAAGARAGAKKLALGLVSALLTVSLTAVPAAFADKVEFTPIAA